MRDCYCVFGDSSTAGRCIDVRCDKCPNRHSLIPARPTPHDAGWEGVTMNAEYTKPDMVLHPKHYARWKMEPIEFIAINNLVWWLANVIKYAMRYDAKDGLQDLYKARSYLEMKIRELEGHKDFWSKPVSEERGLANAAGTANALARGWNEVLQAADDDYTAHSNPRIEGAVA